MPDSTIEVYRKGKWVRVPALHVAESIVIVVNGRWIKIASVHDEEWMGEEVQDPAVCIDLLKVSKVRGLQADIFTFTQMLPTTVPKYDYLSEPNSVAAIRLIGFEEWWRKLPQATRKNVRRAKRRGVEVVVRQFDDKLVQCIKDINDESPMRQGMPNAHYGKSVEQVKKDHCSFLDRSDFICAFFKDEMIGFLKIVYRGNIASVLNLASKTCHADKRPANALMAKAVELCVARGALYLTYGLFNYGNKKDSSLREFKIRNGFEEILVPRYYVPLTKWGTLCVKLGLHRGLLGILPTRIITLLVGLRAKWYRLRSRLSRCSSMVERSNRNRLMGCSNPPAGSNNS